MSVAQPVTFGQLLKRYRVAARMSQETLAERSGLAVRSVSDLERDVRRLPHPDTIQRLADALRLSPQDRAALARTVRRSGSLAPPPTLKERDRALTPFIGRTHTLDLLDRYLAGQEPPALLFGGEPGIGKTRLLQEAAARAQAVGWRVLTGGCTRRSAQASYAPFTGALAQAIARTPRAQLRRDLQGCAWLGRLLPELAEHALTPALGWTIPPEQEQRLLFASVGRYLANVAGPAGTLVALDDLQWAGGDALDLLESLIRLSAAASHEESEAPATPLRILGAYRDTEVQPSDNLGLLLADLARDGLATQRSVGQLSQRDARALADLLLANLYDEDQDQSEEGSAKGSAWGEERSPRPPLNRSTRVEQIVQRAGGVPYYLVTYALGLLTNGSEAEPAVSALAVTPIPTPPPEQVPWQVATSIRQRVSALPQDAQLLLGALSVAGRSAPFALLAAMLARPKESLLHAVEAACQACLLEVAHSEAPHLANYHFSHDLIRETVLQDLSAARRVLLHRAAGDAIETLGFRDRRTAELAYHFTQAEEYARALPYALLAGDQAVAVFAHAEAERQYRAAIELARAAQDEPQEAAALTKLGALLGSTLHHDEGVATLRQALDLFARQDNIEAEARTAMEFALAHDIHGPLHMALSWMQQRLDALTARGLSLRGQIYMRYGLFRLLLHSGEQEEGEAAEALLRAALDMGYAARDAARAANELQVLARTMQFLGVVHAQLGQVDKALARWADTMPLAEEAGELQDLVRAYFNSAGASLARGEIAIARRYADQGVATAARAQVPFHALATRGNVAFICGDWGQARADGQQAVAAMHALNPTATHDLDLGVQCVIDLLQANQSAESTATTASALAAALARSKRHWTRNDLLARLASVLAERDLLAQRPEAAWAHLEPLSRHVGLPGDVGPWITTPLVWTHLALGQREEARQRAQEGVESARAGRYQLFLVDALRARALVSMDRSAWQEATDDLDEMRALCQAMPYPYAEAKALWVYGRLEVARGHPVAARECFTQALAICARLGERLYAEQIERELMTLPA